MSAPSEHTEKLFTAWLEAKEALDDLYRQQRNDSQAGFDRESVRESIRLAERAEADAWTRCVRSGRLDDTLARPDLECLSLDSADDRERLAEILREGLGL